jgi:hypothetical protein
MTNERDRGRHQYHVRLPLDVKQWIESEAEYHCTPQNSVIVRCVRAAMKAAEQQAKAAG